MSVQLPPNEASRLAALRELEILDTAPEQVYDDIVQIAAAIFGVPIAIVNFIDADRQWGKALVGLESSEAPRETSFCARTILADDGVMVVADCHADPRWAGNAMVVDDPNLRFYAGAAISSEEGYAFGTVCVADQLPKEPTDDQLDALRMLARQAASHLQLRRDSARLSEANAELRRLAVEDPLTGLPNRTALFDRLLVALRQRVRDGRRPAVLFGDLDGFKAINDTHGHEAGDAVLRAVADRLQSAARIGDTVARLAGDEFVVLAPDVPETEDLAVIAERFERSVAAPVALGDGVDVIPRMSIGATLADPGDDPESVLRRADAAMYERKRAPRG